MHKKYPHYRSIGGFGLLFFLYIGSVLGDMRAGEEVAPVRRQRVVKSGTDGIVRESIRLGRNAYGPTDKEVLVLNQLMKD